MLGTVGSRGCSSQERLTYRRRAFPSWDIGTATRATSQRAALLPRGCGDALGWGAAGEQSAVSGNRRARLRTLPPQQAAGHPRPHEVRTDGPGGHGAPLRTHPTSGALHSTRVWRPFVLEASVGSACACGLLDTAGLRGPPSLHPPPHRFLGAPGAPPPPPSPRGPAQPPAGAHAGLGPFRKKVPILATALLGVWVSQVLPSAQPGTRPRTRGAR